MVAVNGPDKRWCEADACCGEPMELVGGGCLVSGGAGGGGTVFAGDDSVTEKEDGRRAEAGAVGCENGFPGPLGASVKLWATADVGAEVVA